MGAGAANPFFTDHARHYTASQRHSHGPDLGRLIELVAPGPGLAALDVGTGTGHTALALAEAGADVVGIDPTPAMLDEARALAQVRGLESRVQWVDGVAESLPFPEASFDIVTCRRAAHHFADIPAAVREMARVLRPGGRLGITDMCPEAESADLVNRLERLRDPTHVAALDDAAWDTAVRQAGLAVVAEELSLEEMAFEAWLAPIAADSPQAAAVRVALAGTPEATRLRLAGAGGDRWHKRRLLLCAVRKGRV